MSEEANKEETQTEETQEQSELSDEELEDASGGIGIGELVESREALSQSRTSSESKVSDAQSSKGIIDDDRKGIIDDG